MAVYNFQNTKRPSKSAPKCGGSQKRPQKKRKKQKAAGSHREQLSLGGLKWLFHQEGW